MRPRTINDKGTLDEYRRPKLAYDQVQRAFRGF
jgi:beta-glucuronidase